MDENMKILKATFRKLMVEINKQGIPTEEQKEANRKHYKNIMSNFRIILKNSRDEEVKSDVIGMMGAFTALLSLNGSIDKDNIDN